MTIGQVPDDIHDLRNERSNAIVKEYCLQLYVAPGGTVTIRMMKRLRNGVSRLFEWFADPNGVISEGQLLDILAAFNQTFIEDVVTTSGVQLVLPLAE